MEWTNVFASDLTYSFGASSAAGINDLQAMSTSKSTSFECPNCAARYEVVRVDAAQGPTVDREITCLSCGGPLHGREGPFLLKYFLIERRKRRAGSR
jgi:predicted RNA-binding Zn-ribbon protein involved in translation (DUF1610 family)